MADYLLDTNIVRHWYDAVRSEQTGDASKDPQAAARNECVLGHVRRVRQPDQESGYVSRLFISVVTLSEIEYGHAVVSPRDVAAQDAYRTFIAEQLPPALEIPLHIHEPYATLRAWLFNEYSPKTKRVRSKRPEQLVNPATGRELGIDENDLWIAAHAALHNFVFVTADGLGKLAVAIEKAGIGLKVEDWTKN